MPLLELHTLRRSLLQQTKLLPTNYLRQFFRIKIGDDLHALSDSNIPNYKSKVTRVVKELQRLTAANNGDVKAFQHVLDTAYGRKGKLRWELMEPLLTDPSASSLPRRIIPSIEKSRPPVFAPELKALLGSKHAHKTRPLPPRALQQPPTLPERADPESHEARCLGPFSKRREVNIRWRFFTDEWRKLLPPLHLTVEEKTAAFGTVDSGHHSSSLAKAGVRSFGFQGTDVLEEIKAIAGPAYKTHTQPALPSRLLANRFIRRRYQELLGKTPILTYSYRNVGDQVKPMGYSVSLLPAAISADLKYHAARICTADETDLQWIAAAKHKS